MTNQTASILRRSAAGFALAAIVALGLEGLRRASASVATGAAPAETLPVLLLVVALGAWLLRTPGGLGAAAAAWLACLYRFHSPEDIARLLGLAVALPAVAGAAGLLRRGAERAAADEALRRGDSRLARARAIAGLGSWEVEWPNKLTTWSAEMFRICGVAPDRFTPGVDAFLSLVPPEEHAAIWRAVEDALSGKAPYQVEHRVVRPDGETRYVSEHAEVERDAAGRPVRFAGTMLDVTERRRAEESLRRAYASLEESEQRLRLGLDAGEVGTWDWDIPADRVTWSARLYQFHGLVPGAFDGTAEAFAQLVHPDDDARVREAIRRALEERADFRLEFRTIRPDGAIRWLFTTGRVTFDDATGRPVRMMGATIDVTDRRRVEDVLRESERSLRLVTDHLPALVSYVDRGLRYRFNNRAYGEWFGIPAGALFGRHLSEVLGDDIYRHRLPYVEAALRGEPQRFEGLTRLGDGTTRQTEVAYIPDHDGDSPAGAVRGFYVMVHDVSEHRRVERALRENARTLQRQAEALRLSEERHERAAAAGKVGVWDLDLDSGELYLAPNLKAMLGYDPAEPPHTLAEWRETVHPDDRERVVAALTDHLDGGTPAYEAEVRRRHKHGHYLWCLARGTAVRDEAGRPYRLTGSDTDITDRKRVEEELRQATAAAEAAREEAEVAAKQAEQARREAETARQVAEAASAAKDHFLAVLSHELRTPLTPVLAAASELAGRTDLPPGVAEDARMIRRNVELEARLIDDLLDLTRIARGKLTLNLEPIDAHALVREAAEICAADLAAKKLSLRLHLRAGASRIVADPARLQQVFWNLLKNAIKFTPEGGEIVVHTEGDAERSGQGGSLRVSVRDTGIGLLPGQVPRIFDAFEQADASIARRFGGLGLGLAISRALVELHGGTLAADSDGAGQGSTFTVELPLRAPFPAGANAPTEPPHTDVGANGTGPAEAARRLRILLVEDHDDTRRIMARLLKSFNYDVESAGDVRTALQAAATGPNGFDLAISDLGLPDGTGYELMRELRATYGLRGIALSGYGMDEDIRRSHEAGFVAHVTKPVNLQTLRSVIEQVSGRDRSVPVADVK